MKFLKIFFEEKNPRKSKKHALLRSKDLNILPFCPRSVNITEHPPPILKVVSQMLASEALHLKYTLIN